MAQIIEIEGPEDFQAKVIESELPVFVKFTAEWCGPCKALDPIIDKLSSDYDGKIAFAKIDIDRNLDLAKNFKVRSVPTTLIIHEGKASHVVAGKKGDDWYEELCSQLTDG